LPNTSINDAMSSVDALVTPGSNQGLQRILGKIQRFGKIVRKTGLFLLFKFGDAILKFYYCVFLFLLCIFKVPVFILQFFVDALEPFSEFDSFEKEAEREHSQGNNKSPHGTFRHNVPPYRERNMSWN
jgi:hypothetical protein